MAETSNVAKMATKVSDEVFGIFGWTRVGPSDRNFNCVESGHGKKTHPTDVVFRYEHPYLQKTVYFNVDLKSYGGSSITKTSIASALQSLSIASACASISDEWQRDYVTPGHSVDIVGMLFVYNHDGQYDKDFEGCIAEAARDGMSVRSTSTLYVMGPSRINYLATVANDISVLRGKRLIPFEGEGFWFFYPDLIIERARITTSKSATIESLNGPILVARYNSASSGAVEAGAVVYYQRDGSTVDEFKYLIDYLFRYQILMECQTVRLRLPSPASNASAMFAVAIDSYAEDFHDLPEIRERLKRIEFGTVTNVVTRFSEIELGMEAR